MKEPFIKGIKIAGYRSFKEEVVFDNLSKINLIIGQNNSGKSNLLRFLSRHFLNLTQDKGVQFSDLDDVPRHQIPPKLVVGVKVEKNSDLFDAFLKPSDFSLLEATIYRGKDEIWFYYVRERDSFKLFPAKILEELPQDIEPHMWNALWSRLTKMRGGELGLWKVECLSYLNPIKYIKQAVDLIPATRSLKSFEVSEGLEIKESGRIEKAGVGEHSGIHLIEELFKLQNPPVGKEDNRTRFNKINQFMRDVLGNDSLQLVVPHDKKTVIVEMDDKRLPIESLGSGIEEVLIIAAKATMFTEQIVCIEEPELHLHPTLQRKLLKYLYDETDNQYFIATHSAHLLDATYSSIFHVRLQDGYSQVVSALNERERFVACSDLGYKASDLLQANFIIWVEGPSDRIYLNYWIKSAAPKLVEGLHYSVMFYGGRLMSHLTVNEKTVDEFISLQKLNQNMAIVIDSDRQHKGGRLNKTKLRIRKEFQDRGYFVWITDGKEIENYIDQTIYEKVVQDLYPKAKTLAAVDRYNNMTVYYDAVRRQSSSEKKIDKIRLAHAVSEEPVKLNVLDLKLQLDQLIERVVQANLMDV